MGDVVWGVILGVLAIGFIVFLVKGIGGGSSGTSCDQPLAPLGESPITAAEFAAVDQGLAQTAAAARMGDLTGAENSFFGRVHNFTHNVDPPLRAKDRELAKRLCESVFNLEREFAIERRPEQIALEAENIKQILKQAVQVVVSPAAQ